MKMKGVLLYNISADKLKKIRVILLRLGLQGRVVTPEEFMLPVGQLAGIEGLSPAETAQEDAGEAFREEMLVMCDLPSAVFSAFLTALHGGTEGGADPDQRRLELPAAPSGIGGGARSHAERGEERTQQVKK